MYLFLNIEYNNNNNSSDGGYVGGIDYEVFDDNKCENDINDKLLTEQQEVILKLLKSLFLWQMANFISDCSISKMLVIFKIFLELINKYLQNDWLQTLINELPTSMYSARKYIGIERDSFTKYTVCPSSKCQKMYTFDESYQVVQGNNK